MNREASRYPVVGAVFLKVVTVGARIGLTQTLQFLGVSNWINQWVRGFGLAAEGVYLDKIHLGNRLDDACLLQPSLPTFENQWNLNIGIHESHFIQFED